MSKNRYQGISEWVTTDGKTFWQHTTDAPLPRREYTVRSDYNILKRGNRLILTENGWTHEQDNEKILAKDGRRQVIAQEKGFNIYKRAAEKDCAFANKWWDKQKSFWVPVREEWDALLNSADQLQLQTKIDNRLLHQHLDELASRHAQEPLSVDAIRSETRKLLNKFVKTTTTGLANN
jgi:hypothetical protein